MSMNHEGTISTTAAGKASSKEKNVMPQTGCWDILLKNKGETIRDFPIRDVTIRDDQNQTVFQNNLK